MCQWWRYCRKDFSLRIPCGYRHNDELLMRSGFWGHPEYSRSVSFLSWCLSQWEVGDSGQPVRVWRQNPHTEESRVNARLSELRDLPDLYGTRSSSPSKSLAYSIKNVLINTVSVISSGRSLSFYSNNTRHRLDFLSNSFVMFLQIYFKSISLHI